MYLIFHEDFFEKKVDSFRWPPVAAGVAFLGACAV